MVARLQSNASYGDNGGAIDLVNTVSGSLVTGRVLVLDPQRVFTHEYSSHCYTIIKGIQSYSKVRRQN